MKKENTFWTLLQAGLWQKDLPVLDVPLSKEEWQGIFDLAVKQSLDGIIYDGMMMLPEEQRPDRILQLKWYGRVNKNVQVHSLLNRVLVDIVDKFEEEDIPVLLLKGQGNASFYENPQHRQCGDIDLFIGTKNYERACRLIKDWGMNNAEESGKHLHGEWHGAHIEVHRFAAVLRNPAKQRRFVKWSEEMLNDRSNTFIPSAETQPVPILPPVFNVFFVFYHLLHHFSSSGVGLRQFCDLARLVHVYHGKLNLNELEKQLKGFGLMRQWQIIAYLLVHHIGLAQEECPFYKDTGRLSEEVLRIVLEEGNFGYYAENRERKNTSYIVRKWEGFMIHTRRSRRLIRIFPSRAISNYISVVCRGTMVAIKSLFNHNNKKI